MSLASTYQPAQVATLRPTSTKNGPTNDQRQCSTSNRQAMHRNSYHHLLAGGAGGITSAFCTAPLDVVRTRLQSDFYRRTSVPHACTSPKPITSTSRALLLHVHETLQILHSIYRVEGWRSLFKGLSPNLVGVVPSSAIKFYAYNNSKRIFANQINGGQESAVVHLCAAATAGVAVSTTTNPIWLVKTRLQLDRSVLQNSGLAHRRYKNTLDCILQISRQEGIRGFYRGLSASYLGVAESTLHWMLYEQLKRRLAAQRTDQFSEFTGKTGAAGLSKVLAVLITYPHEVIRTRLRQAPASNGRPKYTGILQSLRLIYKEEGFVALYGGLTPHLMRAVPSTAITFGVYEIVVHFLSHRASQSKV